MENNNVSNKKRKYFFLVFLLIVTIIVGFIIYAINEEKYNPVENGVANLVNWEPSNVISLTGEWNFYWKQLLGYEDIQERPTPDLIASVPADWGKYILDDKMLPSNGYATYHLLVTGVVAGEPLAMSVTPLLSAYDFYIDGDLMVSVGEVGTNYSQHRPKLKSEMFTFVPETTSFDIIIHVSNFTVAPAGMKYMAPYIGCPIEIAGLISTIEFFDMFFLGSYFTLLLAFLSIFILRRSEKKSLYFALLCIIAISRMLFYGDFSIGNSMSLVNYETAVRIVYLTLYWSPAIMALLIKELYRDDLPKVFVTSTVIYAIIFSLFTVFGPLSIFTKWASVAEFISVTMIIYIIFRMCLAFLMGRLGTEFLLVGFAAILLTGLYDLLIKNTIISISFIAFGFLQVGFFIFFLLQAFVLIKRYEDTFDEIERMKEELLDANRLKDQIQQTEIAFLQAQIKPHFLFNTLNTISSFCISDPERAEYLIDKLAEYLRSSFDFENQEMFVSIHKELQLVKAYVDIEKARFGEQLTIEYDIDEDIYVKLPPITIQPLVENAIRHGVRKQGNGVVRITIRKVAPDVVLCSVSDNGVGISKDKLETIFDEKTGGVGLSNIDSRIRRFYGLGLAIESEKNEYTTVSFVIR